MYFDPFNHKNMTVGYQNIELAQAFAKFVVDKVLEIYPESKEKIVLIYGMDNSTTYLSAFVKMLMPHWFFVSGSKETKKIKTWIDSHVHKEQIACSIFIDDYFHLGRAINVLFEILYNQDDDEKMTNELMLFYIKHDSDAEQVILKKAENCYLQENISFYSFLGEVE